MSGRDFAFLMLGIGLGKAISNRRQATDGTSPMAADFAKQILRILRPLYAMMSFGYAAVLAWLELYLVYRLIIGRDPWEAGLYLILPGLPVVSVFFVWLGLVLLGDKNPPKCLDRACRAAIEAFRSPAPNASKPKPAGFGHDLD
jgi:hypothetical protein